MDMGIAYMAAPSVGIYLVVLSVLLHGVAAMESSILEEGAPTQYTSSVCLLAPVAPLADRKSVV